MNRLEKDINLILAGWNPIGVDGHVALTEYISYVQPLIIALKNNFVESYLKSMLSDMGLGFDPNNKLQLIEIRNLTALLQTIYEGEN